MYVWLFDALFPPQLKDFPLVSGGIGTVVCLDDNVSEYTIHVYYSNMCMYVLTERRSLASSCKTLIGVHSTMCLMYPY